MSESTPTHTEWHIAKIRKNKKWHWPFCEGWCPVSNGTPTHTEWHNARIRKNKKWHWPFYEGWRPVNNVANLTVAASATTLGLAHSQHLRRTTLAPMNGCSSHRRLLHRHRQSPKTSGYPMWTHCLTKFIGSTRS